MKVQTESEDRIFSPAAESPESPLKANVLLIDHDPEFAQGLENRKEEFNYELKRASGPSEAARAASEGFDIILMGSFNGDGPDMALLKELVSQETSPEVIVISDDPDPDQAEEAIRLGAWDYVPRPENNGAAALPLVRAIQYRKRKNRTVTDLSEKRHTFPGIVGKSRLLLSAMQMAEQASKSDVNVLISGETGTGKELFATAIHKKSARSRGNFVVVDCASLPETLVESTLFGYEKGAYTGADKGKEGLIKQADKGTLFLDEVGELPLSVQTSFLRVLEEGSFRKVGGKELVNSDFRLIAATNRDLAKMVEEGRFRKDLLFRLEALHIELPSLAERPDDMEELIHYHMNEICTRYGMPQKEFSPDFFEAVRGYGWPGNVRELVNALERAVTAARDEPVIFPQHLPVRIRVEKARRTADSEGNGAEAVDVKEARFPTIQQVRERAVSEAERRYLSELMEMAGSAREAIQHSGLSRSRFYSLLKKYEIKT